MKRCFLIIICISLVFCSCAIDKRQTSNYEDSNVHQSNYIKSLWICYFELSDMLKDKSKEEFTNEFSQRLDSIKQLGFNTITVQVRPFADAFYKSSIFPTSKYCFGKQGSEMLFDPFGIICEIADSKDIKVEAWINPYRVSTDKNINNLSENNIAKEWINDKNNKSNVYIADKGIYFNPASNDVTRLIVDGVLEIVKNYKIYSIHFDDYFYPTTNKDIDELEYQEYIQNGGKLSLNDWRLNIVSNMIKSVYKAIKENNSKIQFGVSPSGNIEYNYNTQYADVKLWASEIGYVDYICPQVYYGFLNENKPFMNVVKQWENFSNANLYIGLPLYKSGKIDKYASKSNANAQNEFIDNTNIISRQIQYIQKLDNIKGFYIFSYNSLIDDNNSDEVNELAKIMQSSNLH